MEENRQGRSADKMRLGMIGLGRMGAGMTQRLQGAGHEVVGFDLDHTKVDWLITQGGMGARSVHELVTKLSRPRVVWLMLTDAAVGPVFSTLTNNLSPGDFVVDGGNSLYQDSLRRAKQATEQGVAFLDVGTSGGVWGEQQGFCLMIGGSTAHVEYLEPLFQALAPAPDRGWGRVGPSGAGHFVKMVHNAVEYGLMQAYSEGFSLLRKKEEFALDLPQVCDLWLNGSVIRSWLLELIANVLKEDHDLADVEPWVADSGHGRWAVQEAIDLETSVPVLTQALFERFTSRDSTSYGNKLLAKLRHEFGGHSVRNRSADHEQELESEATREGLREVGSRR